MYQKIQFLFFLLLVKKKKYYQKTHGSTENRIGLQVNRNVTAKIDS